ncbi:MAG: phosphatidate cytidylyltransferase [Candidatus Omnitrophica bacterium]|nr:phosphatidate cytidylyltransferase [Candidatus Omnitrophota bacterium]
MLLKRITSSVILILLTLGTIFIDWLCGIFISLIIILGLYEYFKMLENKGITIYKYFGMAIGALVPLSIVFRFELTRSWELFFVVLGMLFLILMQLRRRQNSGAVVGISTTIFGILYISWFFSFLIKIRYLPSGIGLLSALLLITKSGDIGAYLVGSRFGKIPLIPSISPHKSLEGSLVGLLSSILAAVASRPLLHLGYLHLIFVGFFFGILAQLGDLSESLIKRDCQVKDSGKIIPGIGGILDLIDSLLFTAPVFYFYINIILK